MVEYETKSEKCTVGEFYKWNKGKLPKIVMATQSFGGNTGAEAYEYVQVIRIHSACRSQRVSAVQPAQGGKQECTYSFPVDSTILFCLVENLNKNEKERLSLAEILRKSTLPVDVHFAKKGIINIGDNTFSTSHFSTLRLTNVSEEIYLLGNYIFDDELDLKIVQIPINLATIKFSEVTGLKGKTTSYWKTFLRKLDLKAAQLNFDVFSGNQSKEISKSTSDGANKEDDIDEADYLQYENLQPSMHTHIQKSIANATQIDAENSEDNTYEFMAPVPLDRVSKLISKFDQTKNKPNETYQMKQRKSIRTVGQDNYLLSNVVGELNVSSEKGSAPRRMADSSAMPQLVGPKSKHYSKADAMKCSQKEQITTNRESRIAVGDCPPELTRPTACKLSGTKREPILSTSFLDSYENTHFGVVCPTTNVKPNEFSIMKGKEKSHDITFQKTLKERVILRDVDSEYGSLAKYKLDAAGIKSDAEDEEHSSLVYENCGEIRGTNQKSLSETASDDSGGLYETMMISPVSSFPGFIKE